MNIKPIIKAFLLPTLLHITAVAVLVGILKEKGYEEELLLSLKRMPTLHTVWMLNRLINGTDQAEVYLELLKAISENTSYDKEIREEALHFLSIY